MELPRIRNIAALPFRVYLQTEFSTRHSDVKLRPPYLLTSCLAV